MNISPDHLIDRSPGFQEHNDKLSYFYEFNKAFMTTVIIF